MKKKIAAIILSIGILFTAGCGDTVINDHEDVVSIYGRFIAIKDTDAIYWGDNIHRIEQELVYDKDTKVIYIREITSHGISLCPYYCIDADGNAVIAIYNAEED